MRPVCLCVLVFGLTSPLCLARADELPGARAAGEPRALPVLDYWDAAYLQGSPAGYVHTSVLEVEKDGAKYLRAAMELRLTVLRGGETIQLAMDTGTYETAGGKVVGTFLKHFVGTSKTLEITGTVDGSVLRLTLDKTKSLRPVPWNPDVVGLARQQRLLHDWKMAPGKVLSYLSFEPSINLVVKTTVRAKDFEDVELFGGKQRQRLLRVESGTDKIQGVQLPTLVSWLGEERTPLRAEAEIPPFGRVTLYRTTRADALKSLRPTLATKLTDIGTSQYVKLARRIAHPYQTTAAVYRIRIQGEDDPAGVFAADARQQVKKVQGSTIELEVRPRGQGEAAKEPPAEYRQSSFFITSDDERVKTLARKAVAGEQDPWKKALRIEKWVNANMRVTSDEALAPADQVARTLRGDCTEFAMLTAAMCRAEGIPARTAVGLIYADVRTGPVFAFHMWTEVWFPKSSRPSGKGEKEDRLSSFAGLIGEWVPLDATLGQGGVGATHLKICDQSWHDTHDQSVLLPVFRVLGRLSIEVVRTEGR
jgi:transglutaminase-like putative cysteine protease